MFGLVKKAIISFKLSESVTSVFKVPDRIKCLVVRVRV